MAIIILVRPQLGENIGAVARAMANGGLDKLRIVAPRDGWPQEIAWRTAAGARAILEHAQLFSNIEEAIADLHHVYGTCPRRRHMVKWELTARGGAVDLHYQQARGLKVGILFGPERSGLTNEDVAHVDALIRFPLNPDYASLNLAQAVMIMAYEWWTVHHEVPSRKFFTYETQIATRGELDNFMGHLTRELDGCGFLRNREKRQTMLRNLRNFFVRGEITRQELQTFHGMVRQLAHPRH